MSRQNLLDSILSCPTAPFKEMHVARAVTGALDAAHVPHFEDPHGNIIVGAGSRKEYLQIIRRRSHEPLRVFMAHMDHPGFHCVKWLRKGSRVQAEWHGGAPFKNMRGTPVWLADATGWLGTGHIESVTQAGHRPSIGMAMILPDKPTANRIRDLDAGIGNVFGGFRFRKTHWSSGKLIHTKAADDLVGVYAITALAIKLARKFRFAQKMHVPFIGLVTRAEEVGFVGAIGHFSLGWLSRARRPVVCISLECSRTLPGARIGEGPVVRLGDKFTPFDAAATQILSQAAAKNLPGRHQRKLMDGGTCEATPAMAHGIPAIGISIPLGNYHNQPLETTGAAAAPEFVHKDDIKGMLDLCKALLVRGLPWEKPWDKKRKELSALLKSYLPLLKKRAAWPESARTAPSRQAQSPLPRQTHHRCRGSYCLTPLR